MSAAPNWKFRPWRSPAYTKFISAKPCCVLDVDGPNDPHHSNIPGHATMGGKCSDRRCVPLAHRLHLEVDKMDGGEQAFWEKYGVDPEAVMDRYYAEWLAMGKKGIGKFEY